MKTLFKAVLMTSLVALSVPAFAASPLDASFQQASLQPQLQNVSMPAGALAPSGIGAPLSLLAPSAMCGTGESRKVCEVRLAAARRANEVTQTEGVSAIRGPVSTGLLIPVSQLLPVASTAPCDPRIAVAECERLQRRGSTVPPGTIPPMQLPPPISPLPAPSPELGKIPPIATDMDSVINPPPTGDHAIIVPPPPTGSDMPVIKPRPAQPVIP